MCIIKTNEYSYSDVNELNREYFHEFGNGVFELTTKEEMGIHLDKSFSTQDIFSGRQNVTPENLNHSYIVLSDKVDNLNLGRCAIYKPLSWKPYREWYKDDLLMDKEIEEYGR